MNVKMLSRIIGLTVLLTAAFMVVPLLLSRWWTASRTMWLLTGVTMGLMAVFGLALSFSAATATAPSTRRRALRPPAFRGSSCPCSARCRSASAGRSRTISTRFSRSSPALRRPAPRSSAMWRRLALQYLLAQLQPLARRHGHACVPARCCAEARKSAGSGMYLMRAESPGPSVGKLTPHLRQTAMILYGMYFLLTLLCVGFLLLGGMPVFDSFCIAFGTAGTPAAFRSATAVWRITAPTCKALSRSSCFCSA